MRVVPEGSGRLIDRPLWAPAGAGSNHLMGAAIHPRRQMHPVPVDGGRLVQGVLDSDLHLVTTLGTQGRPEMIAIEAPGRGLLPGYELLRPDCMVRSKTLVPSAATVGSASGGMASSRLKRSPVVETSALVYSQRAPLPRRTAEYGTDRCGDDEDALEPGHTRSVSNTGPSAASGVAPSRPRTISRAHSGISPMPRVPRRRVRHLPR